MTDSLKAILVDICHGMKDAVVGAAFVFRVDSEIAAINEERRRRREEKIRETHRRPPPSREKKDSEPKVMHRMLQCCALNGGVFWLSIEAFNRLILPAIQSVTWFILGSSSSSPSSVWGWMRPMLSYMFGTLWVLPIFLLSRAVSSLWFQDIADAAYRKSRGSPQLPNLSKFIADLLFSVIIQVLFLIQGMVISLIPIAGLGQCLSLLHLCLLYSLYAFEYKWFNMGWEVHKRLSYIECNWPYFVGFGLPLALITTLPGSYLLSGVLFAILFPLFIISGNEAQVPSSQSQYRLRIFQVVVEIANAMFHKGVNRRQQPTAAGK